MTLTTPRSAIEACAKIAENRDCTFGYSPKCYDATCEEDRQIAAFIRALLAQVPEEDPRDAECREDYDSPDHDCVWRDSLGKALTKIARIAGAPDHSQTFDYKAIIEDTVGSVESLRAELENARAQALADRAYQTENCALRADEERRKLTGDALHAEARVAALEGALFPLVERMERIASTQDCDCSYGSHVCGYYEVRGEIATARALLAPDCLDGSRGPSEASPAVCGTCLGYGTVACNPQSLAVGRRKPCPACASTGGSR